MFQISSTQYNKKHDIIKKQIHYTKTHYKPSKTQCNATENDIIQLNTTQNSTV